MFQLSSTRSGVKFEEKILHLIKENENGQVKSILECLEDVCTLVDESGATLLHYAVVNRNITITKYLIDKGTNVNVQNKLGETPLMLAVVNKDYRMIMLLCKYDANVCIANARGKNVLQIAVVTPKMLTAIIESLLVQLYINCSNDNVETAKKIFECNVPLYHAVLLKNAEITKILIEKHNLDVNARNPGNGERALHVSVQERDLENVRVLVEHNALVNVRDMADKTPLFIYGVTSNYPDQELEILKMLMDAGAEYKSNHWFSGTWQCFPLLSEGTRQSVRLFMQYDIDLHATDQFEQTPVHYLASNDHPNIFKEIQGRDFDVSAADDEGYTPLHKAIANPSSVEYLLNRGADVNAKTYEDGESALFKAFARARNKKYRRSIEILLQHNAEIQSRTMDGVSILDLAVKRRKMTYAEPVLAQLALDAETGRRPLTAYTLKRIKSHDFLRKRFKFYKRQLERLKTNKLCGLVTFYELLIDSEEKLVHHARNPLLVLKLIRIDKKCQTKSYYFELLRRRLRAAIKRARSNERAAIVISRIIQISYRGNYAVANTIVSYLSYKDIERLNEAFS